MENKDYSQNNVKINIGFSDNKIFNLGLSIGFLNLIFIFFNGFPSIKILSIFNFSLFIFLFICSFFFIYSLIKILLFDILLNNNKDELI